MTRFIANHSLRNLVNMYNMVCETLLLSIANVNVLLMPATRVKIRKLILFIQLR